jgi:hypothetical protein
MCEKKCRKITRYILYTVTLFFENRAVYKVKKVKVTL